MLHSFRVIATVFGLALLAAATAGTSARAQERTVLVELFTSQGCSSCPPADSLLGKLAERSDVIALAYHVDYWDYLGWKDTFALPENTTRQRGYAQQANRDYLGRTFRGSFTPEVVVQGTDSLIGSDALTIQQRITAHSKSSAPVTVDLARTDTGLSVRLEPNGKGGPSANVMVAPFTPEARVEVGRGENAGRALIYYHVVSRLLNAGTWNGTEAKEYVVQGVDGPVVVFLQRGTNGRVLASAQLDD
ncbi:MAG: DUF1223 domain-containing protein [Pseudomonadota bacterium]